jgi:hypothetical protein
MATKATMWVHGSIVQIESEEEEVLRTGYGTKVTLATAFNVLHWFHFAITTPVILDDIRPVLKKVFVFYKTTNCSITDIHIYDGPNLVKTIEGLNLGGDHSTVIDTSNSWIIDPAFTIKYGLGISIHVGFSDHFGEILFTAAGANFEQPPPPKTTHPDLTHP